MAKIRKSQPLVPSVLDRLVRGGPTYRRGETGQREILLRELKQCVRRDLEALLNTRQRWLEAPLPEPAGELEKSLVNFGIPDFTSASLGSPERQARLCTIIKRVIETFEPRLDNIDVRLESSLETFDRTLRFHIDALLRAEPAPVRVTFDSILEPVSGTFEIQAKV